MSIFVNRSLQVMNLLPKFSHMVGDLCALLFICHQEPINIQSWLDLNLMLVLNCLTDSFASWTQVFHSIELQAHNLGQLLQPIDTCSSCGSRLVGHTCVAADL